MRVNRSIQSAAIVLSRLDFGRIVALHQTCQTRGLLPLPWWGRACPPSRNSPKLQSSTSTLHSQVSLFPLREASGTSWLPDENPMFGIAQRWGGWEVMLHGNMFVQFLYEPGDEHRTGGFSNRQVSSVNRGMVMARRPGGSFRIVLHRHRTAAFRISLPPSPQQPPLLPRD